MLYDMKKPVCYFIGLLLLVSCDNGSKIEQESGKTQNPTEQHKNDSSYVYVVPKTRTDISLTSLEADFNAAVKEFDAEYATAALASANENAVISPLGMNILLSMLANGADNSTLEELMTALNCDRFSPDSLAAFMSIS